MMKKEKIDVLDKSFVLIDYVIMVLLMFVCIYPFYYVFIYSISNPDAAARGVFLYPEGFTLNNYIGVLKLDNIKSAFLISILRTVLGTVLTIFCCGFFSYLVTQKRLFLRKFFYRLTIYTMYINAGLIPWYITMRIYGLKNSFLLYVLPYCDICLLCHTYKDIYRAVAAIT